MNDNLVLKLLITIIILLQLSNASQTHNQLDPSLKEEKKEKLSASQSISDIVSKASRKLSKHTNVIINNETPTATVKEKIKSGISLMIYSLSDHQIL